MKKALAVLVLLTLTSAATATAPQPSAKSPRTRDRSGSAPFKPSMMRTSATETCNPKGPATYGLAISGTLGSAGSCTNVDVNGT